MNKRKKKKRQVGKCEYCGGQYPASLLHLEMAIVDDMQVCEECEQIMLAENEI